MKRILFFCAVCFLTLVSCEGEKKSTPTGNDTTTVKPVINNQPISKPKFSSDSAYFFTEKQVSFGPRVPNTEAHKKCATWLKNKLSSYGLSTSIQEGQVTAFNKAKLDIKNIIGKYNPSHKNRVLLFAHWDTRPFADRDIENKNTPIDGANDGASGVGVLIEIARQLSIHKPDIGVDIIFFDAEDYGAPYGSMTNMEDSWCLGTQYWAKNLNPNDIKPQYGILLDMVGAKDAQFPLEGTSRNYAPELLNEVWTIAAKLGYSNSFLNRATSPTTDDHLYVNTIAKIPAIDIVHYEPDRSDYFVHHHKHSDTMENIDKNTLQAVGEVVLYKIYKDANYTYTNEPQ